MRKRMFAALACATLMAVMSLVLAGASGATDPSAGCTTAGTTTCVFAYTGAAQTWTVPTGVTSATFDLYGAQGGGTGHPNAPGLGGHATATISVSNGDSIQVNVGGQGAWVDTPSGTFNGGAGGGSQGGGASDIRIGGTALSDRVLVAGGGGGAGNLTCLSDSDGGGGGGASGLPGGPGGCQGPPYNTAQVPGGGGTSSTGGTAGGGATPGDFGVGGSGLGGGGGGGGWYGGGGAYFGAGGGGGSGYGPDGTVFETGVRSGNGLVTITYTSALEQLSGLKAGVDSVLGPKSSLSKQVNKIAGYIAANNTAKACKELKSFIKNVNALAAKKKGISATDAASFIDLANEIEQTIGC